MTTPEHDGDPMMTTHRADRRTGQRPPKRPITDRVGQTDGCLKRHPERVPELVPDRGNSAAAHDGTRGGRTRGDRENDGKAIGNTHLAFAKGPVALGLGLGLLLGAGQALFAPVQASASYVELLQARPVTPSAADTGSASARPGGPVERATDKAPGLEQKGSPSALPPLVSRGVRVPFAYALALTTPPGWVVEGASCAPKTPVSWNDGEPFVTAMERMARESGSHVLLDHERRVLVVRGASGAASAASSGGSSPAGGPAEVTYPATRAQSAAGAATATPSPSPYPRATTPAQTTSAQAASAQGKSAQAESVQAQSARPQSGQRSGATRHPGSPAATTSGTASGNARGDADRLLVSYPAGEGRVSLARPMTAAEAARVLTVDKRKLFAWNHLAGDDVRLAAGHVLWIRDPSSVRASRKDSAQASARTGKTGATKDTALKTAEKTARGQTVQGQTARGRTASGAGGTAATAARTSAQSSAQSSVGGASESSVAKATNPQKAARAGRGSATGVAGAQATAATVAGRAGTYGPDAAPLWQVGPGSLKAQLEAWAARAGHRVIWHADTDLELEAGADFTGTFPEAVRELFTLLRAGGVPYTARLFHGNRILQVEDR